MKFPRKSGVLLHPTSLSGPYGMGEIGPAARRWIHTLHQAGQRYWQVLPLGPTGYGDSPYQCLSTFAGNPMMISFDDLIEEGLLTPNDLEGFPQFPTHRVDFGPVLQHRRAVLQRVCERFSRRASAGLNAELERYCGEQAEWLEEFALFTALKEQHHLRPWTEWAPELVRREPAALETARRELHRVVQHAKILQFLFDRQWRRLRAEAESCGVQIIGDIPIFVSHDSADVWANQELFFLDETGKPTVVAGVPPDYFSATGQLWGNPLYRWELHQQRGYDWWMRRMAHMLRLVDIVRIDHFRGFESYWEIPAGEPTAINGRWVKGPDHDFFHAMQRRFGDIPVIAEDLGIITKDVDALRDDFDLPGMRILHFCFSEEPEPHLTPEGFPENCIVYTGTHDNDTTRGWFWRESGGNTTESEEEIQAERLRVLDMVKTDGSQIHWDLIALAHRLRCHTVIVPLQDILGLGSEARMNVPGRMDGNWAWRVDAAQIDPDDFQRLRSITEWSGRL